MKKLLYSSLSALFSALVLVLLGAVIWFFMKSSKISFQDILFYVGAVPVALFSIGVLGDSFGRGSSTYQLSRSVTKQTANERALQDVDDVKSRVKSGLNWIIAGFLVWGVSYFL